MQSKNDLMAKALYSSKLVGKKELMHHYQFIRPGKDLGQVLVERGLLKPAHYKRLASYIEQRIREQRSTPDPNPVAPVEPVTDSAQASPARSVQTPRSPSSDVSSGSLAQWLQAARSKDASDVHFVPGQPVTMRRFGQLEALSDGVLGATEIESMIRDAVPESRLSGFLESGDLEYVHSVADDRYRVALMRERSGWTLAARVVPSRIRSFQECGLPESCVPLTRWAQGLVLITGPVGCGKSSTMSTLVEMINQNRREHIITIESPIEFVYQSANCQITQREVGQHTQSQASALRGALRQDPDILVISELKDLETIQLAVSAAETGHLVLGTMNTISASRTIYRLIDSFPPEEQSIIRNMVSVSLRGIISQQLIPKIDGSGMIPAFEVLIVNTAISNLIRKDNAHLIGSAMMSGRAGGMVLLDESLQKLVDRKTISGREAYYRAINPKTFERYL